MVRSIAFVNQKGGVGKTSVVFNVAYILQQQGYKVLCVDSDPQGSLTYAFGTGTAGVPTLDDVLRGTKKIEWAIKHIDNNLHLIPADLSLTNAVSFLEQRSQCEYRLREILSTVKDEYDFVLIDCPPSLGMLSVNAIVSADEVVVIMIPELLPLQGIVQLQQTLRELSKKTGRDYTTNHIIVNMYQKIRRAHNEIIQAIKRMYGDRVLNSTIRNGTLVNEALFTHEPVCRYSPRSAVTGDFKNVTKELIERGNHQ